MEDFKGPDSKLYKLSHLRPNNYQVPITSEGQRYLVPLVVTYSSHCVSDARSGTVKPDDEWYFKTDHTGHRVFCPKRWGSSETLPENIAHLINENAPCYEGKNRGVYLHLRNPTAKFPGNGWYVMFNFKAALAPSLVHMGIESHHHRKAFPTNIKNPKPKPFGMVLEQWVRGNQVLFATLTTGALPGTVPVENIDGRDESGGAG